MALTKAERIEIQVAAEMNYKRRLREAEDKKELAEAVQKRMQEETSANQVRKEENATSDDSKKGK